MELFLKGYNHGYILALEKPEILKEYEAIAQFKTHYAFGFSEGSKHGQRQRISQKMNRGKGRDEGISM